jgi:hypothetical protein
VRYLQHLGHFQKNNSGRTGSGDYRAAVNKSGRFHIQIDGHLTDNDGSRKMSATPEAGS